MIEYLDSVVTDELVEGESGLVEDARFKKDYWKPDLTVSELRQLNNLILKDIKTSNNQITDTANWYTTRIDGMNVFAIYSTVYPSNPTLLYESKGARVDIEEQVLLDVMEEYENGTNINGQSEPIMQVLGGDWNPKKHNSSDSVRTVARRRNTGNATVLQRKSSANGSSAFRNILQSIFEISAGDRGRGVKFKLQSHNVWQRRTISIF